MDKINLAVWLLLSLFFSIESYRLGMGIIRAPGPGFLTFWVSLVVGCLAVVAFLKEKREKVVGDVRPIFTRRNLPNILYANLFLFSYAVLLHKIGFFLCTLFFVGLCIKVIGSKNWKIAILVSISVAVATYAIFIYCLGIQLPKGKWIELLAR